MKRLLLILVLVIVIVPVYAAGIEPRMLWVRTITVVDADIPPAFDGKTVAFLADVHHGPSFSLERVKSAVARSNALHPDLILLGGDYAYSSALYIAPCLAELARLEAPLGKFGVLGNHDHWYDAELTRQQMQAAGIVVLDNRAQWITLGEDRIRVGGVGDLWEDVQDLNPTTDGLREEDFAILLSHNPDYAEEIRTTAIDLVLSGHTHGGQVTLLGLWAPLVPSRLGQKYRSGIVRTPFTTVIISNGVGTIEPAFRLLAPPQIILIRLSSGS